MLYLLHKNGYVTTQGVTLSGTHIIIIIKEAVLARFVL